MWNSSRLVGLRPLSMRSVALLLAVAAVSLLLWAVLDRAAADATSGFSGQAAAPPDHLLAAPLVKTATVRDGQEASGFTYPGEVKAAAQVSVLPRGSGRVEKLVVEVGSVVKKGNVIAELDAATTRAQVSQAQANLESAQARHASMEAGPRAEQVAQARANLDSARARLAGMSGGRDEQMAQAQAALEIAWANREKVRRGATEADRQASQTAVDSTRANVQTAMARLETLKQWPTQTEWGQALGAVDAARANLHAAEARLADLKAGPKQADLMAAEAQVAQAKASLDRANDHVDIARGSDAAAKAALGGMTAGTAEKAAAAASASLDAAIERLELLRRSPLPPDLQAAQSAVDVAGANLMAAEFRVDQMKRGATSEDLRQAEAGVAAAEAALASAEARLRQVVGGATEEDLWLVESAVRQAEQSVLLAQKPFRDEDVAQARAAVVAAEQQRLLASNPYTEFDMAMARATVRQAEAALEMTQIALNEMVVTSPIDGVVAERLQSVGSMAGPQTPIVTLVSREVELILSVEDSRVWLVKAGQAVEVRAPAHPGITFPARVATIAPTGDSRSRSFQVKVRPDDPQGRLLPGMFVQATIISAEKEKTVLVPRDALVARSGETLVFVVRGDAVQQRTVEASPAQNGMMEVAAGLEVGEEVVTVGHADLRDGDRIRKG